VVSTGAIDCLEILVPEMTSVMCRAGRQTLLTRSVLRRIADHQSYKSCFVLRHPLSTFGRLVRPFLLLVRWPWTRLLTTTKHRQFLYCV